MSTTVTRTATTTPTTTKTKTRKQQKKKKKKKPLNECIKWSMQSRSRLCAVVLIVSNGYFYPLPAKEIVSKQNGTLDYF